MSRVGGNVREYPETLCWRCDNAVPDRDGERGCDWSREGKPVEGWKATRRDIRVGTTGGGKKSESYRVKKCPQFRPDQRRQKETVLDRYRKRLEKETNTCRVMLDAAMDPRVSEEDFQVLLAEKKKKEENQ